MSILTISLIAMALTTYMIRVLPLVAFRKKIENEWVQDFIFYIPFCVLAAMTFPEVFYSTAPQGDPNLHLWSGVAGAVTALLMSWFERGLVLTAFVACMVAFGVELLVGYFGIA